MNEWLSIIEVETETGIPNPTIRRYIRQHGHHIHAQKQRRGYVVARDSLSVLKQIRDLYDKGMGADDVEEELSRIGTPVTITVDDDEQPQTLSVAEVFHAMTESMNAMNAKLAEQQRTIQALTDQLERVTDALNDATQDSIQFKQDVMNKLSGAMSSMDEIREVQQQVAASIEEQRNQKRGWWPFVRK